MVPEIITITEKKLVGQRLAMSFADNKTGLLWRNFMPRRNEIQSTGSNLYSMQSYTEGFFTHFDPKTKFEKWAAMEVASFEIIPADMETLILPPGLYAVFHYKGSAENAAEVFGYILREWLPQSGYVLDNRPHFEVLGERYKNNHPDSEEDIYIPIRPK